LSDVTRILSRIASGDAAAAEHLLPLVYDELRNLAAAKMAREKPGQTLEATALVHEAYLRLVDGEQARQWDSRGHFFAAAAEAMRRILVENARRKKSGKHEAPGRRQDVHAIDPPQRPLDGDLVEISDALDLLAADHPRKTELVKLRFFVGMTNAEAADCLGISSATADRDWAYAKAWLHRRLSQGRGEEPCSEIPEKS
jgi:RNA polymerase sigma factor (TIGR02999 family)